MKRNDGFTLVELVVAIAASSLVTIAAVSLLLLGARTQKISLDDAGEQQTTRIVMSLLEEMAGRGEFNLVEATDNGWQLWSCENPAAPDKSEGSEDAVVFSYKEGSIYRGEAEGNAPLLTGLNKAAVNMEPNNVVRLSFETAQGGSYVTRVHCRTMDILEGADTSPETIVDGTDAAGKVDNDNVGTNVSESVTGDGVANRIAFLQTLAREYNGGANDGRITATGQYYSEWYLDAVYDSGYAQNPGWNANTPWCACFLSWAAVQDWSAINSEVGNGNVTANAPFVFANVDDGMARFQNSSLGGAWKTTNPLPGDYIFFDWTAPYTDPSHVGVVLDVDGNYIYTIEGNSSNKVAVRVYGIDDDAIIGYGVLPAFNS